eukprot:gnl/TRDRNA2_/TRDRNA2_36106_c0_seq1.p1 gnl/TRDRNA2_/TRDRNA2_36106_c0~~gnl/TRDRNA2_/TRDRNA2_36106_c0_seq1.p1  ORF type:complete len:213 (-),score=34.27 gnl/TRDRNA2_/TRDRNA2_36106_c0_seq1:106-744(-)
MIQANKATVMTGFHKEALQVRNLELSYFLMVFDKMSSISSLLAGFASSALMVGIPRKDNLMLKTAFLASTGCALGAHLLVVIISTMCTMWGPGLALRGEDGSMMDNAVHIMDTTKDLTQRYFFFGLVCYFFSSIVVVWLLFDTRGAVTVTVVFGFCLVWLWCKSVVIARALLPKQFTSGRVKGNLIKNVGELMGDGSLAADKGISASFATNI